MGASKVSKKFTKKATGALPSAGVGGDTYGKMIRFHQIVAAADPGVTGSSLGINEAKTSVIKAVLGGQYDVQALSSFSGLSVPEVISILQEMKGFGKGFNEVKV
jgi:hypothetical protein